MEMHGINCQPVKHVERERRSHKVRSKLIREVTGLLLESSNQSGVLVFELQLHSHCLMQFTQKASFVPSAAVGEGVDHDGTVPHLMNHLLLLISAHGVLNSVPEIRTLKLSVM